MIRCFIAIDFPREIMEEIERVQKELKGKKNWQGKLTETENIHLTLKFLGEIDEKKVEIVKKRLHEIRFPRFNSYIGNLGVFTPAEIKIVWIHIIGEELIGLQKWIDEMLWDLFPKEKRFMSHLTIARVKKVKDTKLFLEELGKIKTQNLKIKINDFYLFESKLKPTGPEYVELEKFRLM